MTPPRHEEHDGCELDFEAEALDDSDTAALLDELEQAHNGVEDGDDG